ncbi:50S ribosomal protein L18 [Marinoscillum sp. MHG1-6]|uniref:50S ribosomal protein L18 n=1 Tax=Marinoscillum sp. MHG1-6 TaxID=2959627 RepID=UPI002157BB1A|nr:50S ribosomal protein L18 [Marinoscillum sp. MHG1-6]
MAVTKLQRRARIKKGIRRKISGTGEIPRVSVFRSNKAIYGQIIDDLKGVTLVSASLSEVGKDSLTVETSKEVGKKLAEKAVAAGINSVVFDRNGYPYHGRVKAFAEGAREGGLKF